MPQSKDEQCPERSPAREEIEARIETLTGQRTRTLGELATSEEFGRKCHENNSYV